MPVGDPNAINRALCRALGLDPAHVQSVDIKLRRGEYPLIEVQQIPGADEADDLVTAVGRYRLVGEPAEKGS